jgi:hypothetical protein
VQDRNLFTGQNPHSAAVVAERLLKRALGSGHGIIRALSGSGRTLAAARTMS